MADSVRSTFRFRPSSGQLNNIQFYTGPLAEKSKKPQLSWRDKEFPDIEEILRCIGTDPASKILESPQLAPGYSQDHPITIEDNDLYLIPGAGDDRPGVCSSSINLSDHYPLSADEDDNNQDLPSIDKLIRRLPVGKDVASIAVNGSTEMLERSKLATLEQSAEEVETQTAAAARHSLVPLNSGRVIAARKGDGKVEESQSTLGSGLSDAESTSSSCPSHGWSSRSGNASPNSLFDTQSTSHSPERCLESNSEGPFDISIEGGARSSLIRRSSEYAQDEDSEPPRDAKRRRLTGRRVRFMLDPVERDPATRLRNPHKRLVSLKNYRRAKVSKPLPSYDEPQSEDSTDVDSWDGTVTTPRKKSPRLSKKRKSLAECTHRHGSLRNPTSFMQTDEDFEIRRIVGEKIIQGKLYYKVRWTDTYEPNNTLKNASWAVREYKARHRERLERGRRA